ncbi:ribonuclease III [Candidatus Saccharibacteria bacterium]|nr:ribonuclease III [Candidatus Saccharibacteria bacterium]
MDKGNLLNNEQIEEYQKFAEDKLGFRYHNIDLLITALTHRSYVNEHKKSNAEHNERLEFLGDAVLEVVVSDYLYRHFNQSEGVMTALRSALVRTESIGAAGEELGYAPLVRLSRGEKAGSERAHAVIFADCFEAIIGSIYLDQGYRAACKFIHRNIICKLPHVLEEETWRDPKSYFQELAQHYEGVIPTYRTVGVEGPDHNREYHIALYVGDTKIAEGVGHSKQDAQVIAAQKALAIYRLAGRRFPLFTDGETPYEYHDPFAKDEN